MAHLNRKIGIPSFDMTGKTAIITGGTQGLGFGMACALAAYGANVVITARTASKVEDAVADLNENYCKGGRAFGIPADSSKLENVKMVIEKTVEEFGELNILINNAGISGPTALVVENREGRKEYTPEDFSNVLATNLTGTFMFCQEAARQMIKQNATNGKKGGKIIITASVGGFIGGLDLTLLDALRHLVEGMFSYVDTILVISTAMVFMKVIEASGALDAVSSVIIEKFHKLPALMLCLIMIIVMFPGMITGSSTASVLSAGSIMAPVLMMMGVPALETASILAMGGILGMIAPPTNLPAMIIGAGIDIPYSGFELPLALLTFPLAFVFVLMFAYKYVKKMDYEAVKNKLNTESRKKFGFRVYIPIIAAIILMVVSKMVPAFSIGMPLVFLISAIIGCFTGYKVNLAKVAKDSINSVLPVMGILMGVGMFIQIMTLTGVRGLIVTSCLSLPGWALYVAMAVSMPLFGAVSSFGSASVLGVPFLLAFLNKEEIIVAAALSLIASLGDMMPPTALAGIFAAQVVGLEKYTPVLKKCLVPCLMIIVWGILFILGANVLEPFIIFT